MNDQLIQELRYVQRQYGHENMPENEVFLHLICKNILGITDKSDMTEMITDGANDHGIDIFDLKIVGKELLVCLVQSKFHNQHKYNISRNDINELTSGFEFMCNPHNGNPDLIDRYEEFKSLCKDVNKIRINMYMVAPGELSDNARIAIKNWNAKHINHEWSPKIEVYDLKHICYYIGRAKTGPLSIKFNGGYLKRIDENNKKSIHGYVKASDLIDAIKKHSSTIYLMNPRERFEKSKMHGYIAETIIKTPKKFWKLNNGITATCNKITDDKNEEGLFTIENMKVVNGRQTTSVLYDNRSKLDDVIISLLIHESAENSDEYYDISQATNTQHPIKPADLKSNSEELHRLETACVAKYDLYYFERQTNYFQQRDDLNEKVTLRRCLQKTKTARSYIAYSSLNDDIYEDPNEALMTESKIYEEKFKKIFKNRDIREFIIPHIFKNILETLVQDWKNNNELYYKIFRKKITSYFVLRLIRITRSNMPETLDIEDKIIDIFGNIPQNGKMPDELRSIVKNACDSFIHWLPQCNHNIWPDDIKEKLENEIDLFEISHRDIEMGLKKHGTRILKEILNQKKREQIHFKKPDMVKKSFENILSR